MMRLDFTSVQQQKSYTDGNTPVMGGEIAIQHWIYENLIWCQVSLPHQTTGPHSPFTRLLLFYSRNQKQHCSRFPPPRHRGPCSIDKFLYLVLYVMLYVMVHVCVTSSQISLLHITFRWTIEQCERFVMVFVDESVLPSVSKRMKTVFIHYTSRK